MERTPSIRQFDNRIGDFAPEFRVIAETAPVWPFCGRPRRFSLPPAKAPYVPSNHQPDKHGSTGTGVPDDKYRAVGFIVNDGY